MASEQVARQSRRALLVAGLGGLVATVASALGRPGIVRAGTDGDVVLGGDNTATRYTFIKNTTDNDVGILVNAVGASAGIFATTDSGHAVAGDSGSGVGVYGHGSSGRGVTGYSGTGEGVYGESVSNYGVSGKGSASYGVYGTSVNQVGVYGESTNHPGVVGTSTNSLGVSGTSPNGSGVSGSSGIGYGVFGHSNATNRAGTTGQSDGDSTGVLGMSGSPVPDAPAKTGVYGEAAQDSTAKGVWGKSNGGRGVYGQATSGQGVRGYASTTGTALYGSTAGLKKGVALRTVGRVAFDHCVGTATIASGQKSVVVTPGIDLLSTSTVVATIQGNPSGTMTVRSVAVDATADTFTIYLTANATVAMTVAWHVFG
jgi:hypothetical protein